MVQRSTMEFDAQITFCIVADLDETSDFYVDVLKLPLVLEQSGCRIFRTCRDGYLGFCERDEGPSPDGVILTLVTECVESFCEEVALRGAELEKEPTYNEKYDITQAFLRDPSGYLIEIQRFEDPRWAEERDRVAAQHEES